MSSVNSSRQKYEKLLSCINAIFADNNAFIALSMYFFIFNQINWVCFPAI